MGWIIYTLLGIGIIVLLVLIIYLTLKKPTPQTEGFLDYFDVDTYLKTLKTTVGRYVRIYRSSGGDKYLSISQVKVLDMNGVNIALNKSVSTNISPEKYIGSGGRSADISVTVDGTDVSRAGLSNTWQSGSPMDDGYWQVDLGDMYQISQVTFIGRADSDNIMLTWIKNMRAVVLDDNNQNVDQETFTTTAIVQTVTFDNFMNITPSPVDGVTYPISPLVLKFNGTASVSTKNFSFIDLDSVYTYVIDKYGSTTNIIKTPDNWVLSNKNLNGSPLYGTMIQTSPINFLYEINDSNINSKMINIKYYGTISNQAQTDMEQSLSLCQRIFLGSIDDVERFINISYADLKPYIRAGANFEKFCRPELIQTLVNQTNYITTYSVTDATTNSTLNCNTPFTNDMLGLLPYVTREFVKKWIFNRTQRIIQTKFADDSSTGCDSPGKTTGTNGIVCGAAMKAASDAVLFMNATVNGQPLGLDISNKAILDSIAQAFHEAMNGKYIMNNISDISTIGGTIFDIRFDLQAQADTTAIQSKIAALNTQYQKIQNSTKLPQDSLDNANFSYETEMANLENQLISAVLPPVIGVVGRFFYTYDTSSGKFEITGFTLDARCVTSFIPEFNCGAEMNSSGSTGNVSYSPTIKYTKNPSKSFSCTDPTSIKKIMKDYTDSVLAGDIETDVDLDNYNLRVTSVNGAQSAPNDPFTCQIAWTETAWDDNKNKAGATTTRKGTFPYTLDQSIWGITDPVLDVSGFNFISDTINAVGPYVYAKPIPANSYLDNSSDACPNQTTCEDLSVLFSIADQYNADPTVPGAIIRITRAVTANQYQCDIEADMNYDITVDDTTGKKVKKGSFTFDDNGNQKAVTTTLPSGVVKLDKLSINVHMDAGTCTIKYDTAQSSSEGGGLFIQSNTPALYKPMEYATQLQSLIETPLTSSLNSLSTALTNAGNSAEPLLKPFRQATLTAAGALGFLGECPTVNCKNTNVLNSMMTYYKSKNLNQKQINTVSAVGTMGPDSCDITFQEDILAPTGAGSTGFRIVSSDTSKGMRFIMKPSATDECVFNAVSMIPILPIPPDSALIDVNRISSGDKASEVFVITKNRCSYYNAINATSEQANLAISAGMQAPAANEQTCYGIKPVDGTDGVKAFNTSSWNTPFIVDNIKMPTTARGNSFSYSNPQKEAFTDYGPPIQVSESTFPLNTPSFGLDKKRNNGGNIQTYYDEPLRQAETTVQTKGSKTNSYRYIRFRPYRTRVPSHPRVNVAKFRFFLGKNEVDTRNAKATNPMGSWVGDIQDVTTDGYNKGWSDMNKKAIVFAFPYPVLIDGFTWTTADPDAGIDGDPVRWKLEGSSNGTYWITLRDQSNVSYPVTNTRFQELPIFRF